MTHDEYIGLWKALKKKEKVGLITEDEYAALGGKLDKAYQDKKTAQDIAKEIGCDPGTLATDESVLKLGKELKKVYGDASKEIQAELDAYLKKFGPEIHDLEAKAIDGTITEDELKHLKLMTLQKNILNQKADQLSGMMLNANKKAMGMINGEQLHVFAENANWQSYQLTQDTKMNLSFSVYDEHTAAKLLKDKPELLPRKEVKGQKDKAWNRKIIAGAVLQGVIQGDSIPKLAKRIAVQTGETNMKAMTRYARTAMTSAQNSGRQEMLHKAKGMGIKCKKVWLATLDRRTRDSHRNLDGQVRDIDDPFDSDYGKIMFPGDPEGHPGDVYNCRCTLTYQYLDYPADPLTNDRLMYEEWDEEVPVKKKDKNGKEYETKKIIHHRESKLVTDLTYNEWMVAKQGKNNINSQTNTAKSRLQQKIDQAIESTSVVQGVDISMTWDRRKEQYDFEIEDIISAQGFDGVPTIAKQKDFEKAVTESGIIAQRTYSAPDIETLKAYQDQLYSGKWYVDCSARGGAYGQGMYATADFDGKTSKKTEEATKFYQGLSKSELGESAVSRVEIFTMRADAKIAEYRELYDDFRKYGMKIEEENTRIRKEEAPNADLDLFQVILKNAGLADDNNARKFLAGNVQLENIGWEEMGEIYHNLSAEKRTQIMGLVSEYNEKRGQHRTEYINKRLRTEIKDIGAYAASKGYDAIRVTDQGVANSTEFVVLNRTKCIFRGD